MTTLGKYELHEVLGKGGFGTVYRATDLTLGRVVAIKVLNPAWMAEGSEAVERFRREARIMAQLEHPNVATIHEVGEEHGQLYIVMRYLPGKSLAERLKDGPVSVDLALRIMKDVCAGLQSAHVRGWVHRDLKPANILFDADDRAVITDFGLARAVDAASSQLSSTGTVGTPFYRAPELWNGKPPASPATDVYALGCILGEMLTGKALFVGETPAEVLTRHLATGPDFGANWPPSGIAAGCAAVVERALQRDPAQRYASAANFMDALQQSVQAKPAAPQAAILAPITVQVPLANESQNLTITLPGGEKMEFVWIAAGEFVVGEGKVYLDEYWMGKYPVTNAQYAIFVNSVGWHPPQHWTNGLIPTGKENHPVVQIYWNDAAAFCKWVGVQVKEAIALPTEAQWEKAARGLDARQFPWGNKPPNGLLCNFNNQIRNTTQVGKYSPQGDSPYGCADMAGNVWEWVADWYSENYYAKFPQSNPTGPERGNARVLRGGGWGSSEYFVRSAYRIWDAPDLTNNSVGFRCARSLL